MHIPHGSTPIFYLEKAYSALPELFQNPFPLLYLTVMYGFYVYMSGTIGCAMYAVDVAGNYYDNNEYDSQHLEESEGGEDAPIMAKLIGVGIVVSELEGGSMQEEGCKKER
ncbi:unnamed protein product [Sphagnum balticum]